jgi:hypothetical protein
MKNKEQICDKTMKFEDCELAILRSAVDKAEERTAKKNVNTPIVKQLIEIVENFLSNKKLICYGGTAINNILPTHDQFYDLDVEIPDYDFFSPTPLEHAKELADIYHKAGFEEVEAKAGVHYGTFKVFVNFIPVADITLLDKHIFNSIKKDTISISGILYSPPNFLRMLAYLELSRPAGDVTRWEKVMKRLSLLNTHYPMSTAKCNYSNYQRTFDSDNKDLVTKLYEVTKQSFVNQGVIFFGGFASFLYSQYMNKNVRNKFTEQPDFDILSENAHKTCIILKERLNDADINNVSIVKRPSLGEIIATHYEVRVGKDTIAFVYEPLSCHSYNVITIGKNKIKVATIDTMLSFYLAFIYANRPYYDSNRILCMSTFLFYVQQKNRLKQKGLLRRFSISCMGKQHSLEDIRGEKADKFKELSSNRNSTEYEMWFLKYRPDNQKIYKHKKPKHTLKKRTSTKKTRKKKN